MNASPDQSDAVVASALDELRRYRLRGLQAVGLQVLGQHGARHVDRENDVDPLRTHGLAGDPGLRARERDDESSKREHPQAEQSVSVPTCAPHVGLLDGRHVGVSDRSGAKATPAHVHIQESRDRQAENQELGILEAVHHPPSLWAGVGAGSSAV